MGQTARFQETQRRLTMIDEGFVEGRAGLGLGLAGTSAWTPRPIGQRTGELRLRRPNRG
jgi:hypothetical protein